MPYVPRPGPNSFSMQVVVQASLGGADLQAGSPTSTGHACAQPTAYPVPQYFESQVKLSESSESVLTDDTINTKVRIMTHAWSDGWSDTALSHEV